MGCSVLRCPANDLRGDADLYDYCVDDPVSRADYFGLAWSFADYFGKIKKSENRAEIESKKPKSIAEELAQKSNINKATLNKEDMIQNAFKSAVSNSQTGKISDTKVDTKSDYYLGQPKRRINGDMELTPPYGSKFADRKELGSIDSTFNPTHKQQASALLDMAALATTKGMGSFLKGSATLKEVAKNYSKGQKLALGLGLPIPLTAAVTHSVNTEDSKSAKAAFEAAKFASGLKSLEEIPANIFKAVKSLLK